MEDRRKLIAVITGAISAYVQMEQPPAPIAPGIIPKVKPKPKVSRWKISGRQRLITGGRKLRR